MIQWRTPDTLPEDDQWILIWTEWYQHSDWNVYGPCKIYSCETVVVYRDGDTWWMKYEECSWSRKDIVAWAPIQRPEFLP